ncbi:calcium spray protein [Pseudomassariella vexata]|uniref:Calcium spray protein n=1 Tax=Pseudomassariella vexata TaxID=1141098 RepID=A0A1Y2EJE4_9PEZI|nr:calcium spray protein [Pseudomassariella vexata]ORY71671.1 calcium spray protein [Pseudomassariella vexata]
MRISSAGLFLAIAAISRAPVANAERVLSSTSLNTCQENSGFTASRFNVVFTPNNASVFVNMLAVSSIESHVVFDIAIFIYGYEFMRRTINPCDTGFAGFCPMTAGKTSTPFNLFLNKDAVDQIPTIAYTFPDLDAKVRVFINSTDGSSAGHSVACVETNISNGKTVDLLGVKWAAAIVTGLALLSSAIFSGLGHSNTASHVAANALSLCSYFQAQAIVGLVRISLPPVVQAWTQDFQWSLGIIKVAFLESIYTWYQRATGGTPSELFSSLAQVSVQVEKRALHMVRPALDLFESATARLPVAAHSLARRADTTQTSSGSYVITGIPRVAFRALIETTNIFMTGVIFFWIILLATIVFVAAFKGLCEAFVKAKWMRGDIFQDFRNGWRTVLKGILFRISLIGYAPIAILCLWQLAERDSAAEVVLAIGFFLGLTGTLAWASYKVIRIAKRSVTLHKNPAYILFSDLHTLNKWGFLYIQFRASAYYFIVPVLGYTLLKAIFIAFASGAAQAIALIIIEAAALIAATVLRPWMDKKTNSFNIAICVVNFLNAIMLLIFTEIFNQPPLATGIVGVVLWILNAAFTLVLLIMLIITTTLVFFHGNPDGRYQYMADDRTSFMKSQSQLNTTTELDALGAAARGDGRGGFASELELHSEVQHPEKQSLSSDRWHVPNEYTHQAPSVASSGHEPHTPITSVTPTQPAHPSDGLDTQNNASPHVFRAENNASPWQRGAGYEH